MRSFRHHHSCTVALASCAACQRYAAFWRAHSHCQKRKRRLCWHSWPVPGRSSHWKGEEASRMRMRPSEMITTFSPEAWGIGEWKIQVAMATTRLQWRTSRWRRVFISTEVQTESCTLTSSAAWSRSWTLKMAKWSWTMPLACRYFGSAAGKEMAWHHLNKPWQERQCQWLQQSLLELQKWALRVRQIRRLKHKSKLVLFAAHFSAFLQDKILDRHNEKVSLHLSGHQVALLSKRKGETASWHSSFLKKVKHYILYMILHPCFPTLKAADFVSKAMHAL